MMRSKNRLVYSTEKGDLRKKEAIDTETENKPSQKTQKLRCQIEKRAQGKIVTVISGLNLGPSDLKALLWHLKKKCGTGGSLKEDHIELQGDHCQKVLLLLSKQP